jgi:heat shock protein HslJ
MHASNSFPIIHMAMRSRLLGIVLMLLTASCTTDHEAARAGSLAAREWKAITIDGRPTISAGPVPSPRIQFYADSRRVTGSTGCNHFEAPYSTSGSSVTFGVLAMTHIACLETPGLEQEQAFTAALNETTNFSISGDTLTFFAGSTPRLRFVPCRYCSTRLVE